GDRRDARGEPRRQAARRAHHGETPARGCARPVDLPAVHRGRYPERSPRGSLHRPRRRGERHRAGGVPVHDQPARVVGVVRRDGHRTRRADRDVAGRLARCQTVASGIRGPLGGGGTVNRLYDGTLYGSRRDFLTFGAGAFLGVVASWRRATLQAPDSLPGTGPSGRLWDPARAGRPLEPVTAADNDAVIQAIEKELHCTCGCNLDVYTCRTTDSG